MALETIPPELPVIWFGNGTQAKTIGGTSHGLNKYGEPITRFILKPSDTFKKLNRVNPDELEKGGTELVVDIPSKYLYQLSPYEPSNNVTFVMADYRGRHIDFTRWFYCHKCGIGYPNVHDLLKIEEATIKSKEIQIAQLREELREASEAVEIKLADECEQRISENISSMILRRLQGGESSIK